MNFSIVIPVFNEFESISVLLDEITNSLKRFGKYEIIVVNDCSDDQTLGILKHKKKSIDNLRVISHKKNYGQSASIRTGIICAKYDWIVTLDGDGQNDPHDIEKIINFFIREKYDKSFAVVGFRHKRKDSLSKRISSKLANKVRDLILRDQVEDTGCGLKLFHRSAFLELGFFDHMHRYLPALFKMYGLDVISFKVNHRYRAFGKSKYGFSNRFWVGLVDLLGVLWLKRRAKIINFQEND